MRLTLRTLLAYLDDTLDVTQAREIGPKVGESDVARELIDRIRKVTRRRGLAIPEDADPNTVAEYLDNDLATDKLAEVEEQAIKSDAHLAEIAACHQLLTLITTEPAQVPPTARQRMYGLVKGPEADPNRPVTRVKAATLAEVELPAESDGDELLSQRGGATRLYWATGLTIAMLGAAYMAMRGAPPAPPPSPPAPVAEKTPPAIPENKTVVAEVPKDAPGELPKDAPKEKAPDRPAEQPKEKGKATAPVINENKPAVPDLAAERKTSDDRKELGKCASSSVLLQAVHDKAAWARVPANGNVFGAARLLSLPGLSNEVRLGDSVAFEMFGTLPEFQLGPFFESAVALFAPPKGFDADLRVDNGRVYLRAMKKTGAKVRLRLGEDLFDISIPDDITEIIAERVTLPDSVPFERDPTKQRGGVGVGMVGVPRGTAKVSANLRPEVVLSGTPTAKFLLWNADKGPAEQATEAPEPPPFWARVPNAKGPDRAAVNDLAAAAKKLPAKLGEADKDISVAVAELASDRAPFSRRLSLYCQSALDDVSNILDAFDDPNPEPRVAAVDALHHWLGRDASHAAKLYEALLRQKGYTEAEAVSALGFYFGYDDAALQNPKTYAAAIEGLKSPRPMIREVAYWRLREVLDPEGAKAIPYNPIAPDAMRQRAAQDWKRRIPEGSLPPSKARS
ncbi:MAG: hypothetical protein K1X57_16180 [Gemmataceae bacterium]|nr:hypothetical protein [Gemmataceae bacterium]